MAKKVEHVRNLVVWSLKRHDDVKFPQNAHVTYANPRFWDGKPRPKHDAVYAPDYPKIEEVFRNKGILVYRPDGTEEQEEVKKTEKEPAMKSEDLTDQEVEDLQETSWKSLPASQLKKMAAEHTDSNVKNKEEAIEVLEQAEKDGKFKP